MKKIAFSLLGVVSIMMTACLSNNTQPVDLGSSARQSVSSETPSGQHFSDPTPEVVDWDGRWSGVSPCASCPGIEVDLIFHNDATFRMREFYQDRPAPAVMTEGTLSWDESTRVLTLSSPQREQKILFVGEGEAIYLDADGSPLPLYTLTKQAEYRALGQQLILPLQSIRVENEQVFFKGLLNFKEEQESGFKSVRGEAVIDCQKQHVSFRDAAYYPQVDAMGERIKRVSHLISGGFSLRDSAEESVVLQVAETFCPKR